MTIDIIAIADDFQFCESWRAVSDEDRAAMPLGLRTQCFDRFRKLTPYIDATIERAQRKVQRQNEFDHRGQFVESVALIDAASIAPESVRWLWEGFLARGKLHVLAGAPGTGKTMIALALAATVSSGGHWPDGTRCKPGFVVIWSAEDDRADTLVPRLTAMGANLNNIGFVGDKSTRDGREPFDPAGDMPALMRAVASRGEIKLLIVDPIVSAVAGAAYVFGPWAF